jgi:hypothetical protein
MKMKILIRSKKQFYTALIGMLKCHEVNIARRVNPFSKETPISTTLKMYDDFYIWLYTDEKVKK